MSCLDATFTLTLRSLWYYTADDNYPYIHCYGRRILAAMTADLSELYATNRLYFDNGFSADPSLNYTQWANRKRVRYIDAYINLGGYAAAHKQLALIFGFDVLFPSGLDGHVLIWSDAGQLDSQQLVYGDYQFLLQIDSLDLPLHLYFIHAGGDWFFRGLSGYVV